MKVEVTIDGETGAGYFYLQSPNVKSYRTEEIEDGFLVDFDETGDIVGFELVDTEGENPERQALMKVMSYLTGQIKSHGEALDELREYAAAV